MEKLTFEAKESLSLENSFGTIKKESDITLSVNLYFVGDTYTSFEFYDEKTGGEDWYAEGGIWHDEDKVISDYDGVFSLPECIIDKLNELGYNTEEI